MNAKHVFEPWKVEIRATGRGWVVGSDEHEIDSEIAADQPLGRARLIAEAPAMLELPLVHRNARCHMGYGDLSPEPHSCTDQGEPMCHACRVRALLARIDGAT